MKKRIGVYLAAVLVTVYLFLMYDEAALTAILVLECIYPLFSFFYLKWMKGRMTAGLYKIPAMGEKHGKIRIRVWVNNASRFWTGKYRVDFRAGNSLFSGQTENTRIQYKEMDTGTQQPDRRHTLKNQRKMMQSKMKLTGTAESGQRKLKEYILAADFCGKMSVCLDCLWIYDFLGIFSSRVKLHEEAVIGILPGFELMPLEITRRTREFLADAEEHSAQKGGDDPAETYRIREYRPMDSVHDIHWKLTAKEGELMVKERGFPLGCVVLLWLDFPEKGMSAAGFDRMLERAASLSMTLAEEKCIHMSAWFEEKNEQVVKFKVNSAQSAYELVWQLLDLEPYQNSQMAQIAYEDAFLGDHFSSIVVIDGQGEITVNGEKQELLQL